MVLYGVIADDLTGACDVGVQFKSFGMRTTVHIGSRNLSAVGGANDLIILDIKYSNQM